LRQGKIKKDTETEAGYSLGIAFRAMNTRNAKGNKDSELLFSIRKYFREQVALEGFAQGYVFLGILKWESLPALTYSPPS